MKECYEYWRGLGYKLYMIMGIPMYVLRFLLVNSSVPISGLKKSSITYHFVSEVIAVDEWRMIYVLIDTHTNLANVFIP